VVLITAGGVFAAAEIALVSMRRSRLQELVEAGNPRAQAVATLRRDPERLLATVQVGMTVISVTAAAFGGARMSEHVRPLLEQVPWLSDYADQLSIALVVGLVSFLTLVLGELVPKSLALRSSERYSLLFGTPLLGLSRLARPLVWLLTASSNVVLRLFGDRTSFGESRLSADEIELMVEQATQSGTLDVRAGEIVSRAFTFAELTAADVMVPRGRIVAIPRHASADEVRRILLEEGHSRMPVYERTIDNVVGYISMKDVVSFAWENQLIVLEDLMRPAYFVPETMLTLDLLQELQKRRMSLAIVVDEAGGMSGLVTMEDLLEELVGEIFSEHEEPPESPILRQADGSSLVQGITPVRDVNRELHLELPESDEYSTIAGLATSVAGRIPSRGEKMRLADGTLLEVIDVTPRRVRMVKVLPPPPASPEA
jgi:putative hemolysin